MVLKFNNGGNEMDELKTYEFDVEEVRIIKKRYYIDDYDYKTALERARNADYDEVSEDGHYEFLKQKPKIISGRRIVFSGSAVEEE